MRFGYTKSNHPSPRPLVWRKEHLSSTGQAQAAEHGSSLGRVTPRTSLAGWCGILAVLIYFMRGTVFPRYLHVPDAVWLVAAILTLSVIIGLTMVRGGRWRWSWLLVIFSFAPGLFEAEEPKSAGLRWVGLAMLIFAVGPVILNPAAVDVRSAAWKLTIKGLTTLTCIFVVWYGLHLPSLGGTVYFTSFMNQSMLLGPIAGLGSVIALTRALHGRSWRWGLLAVLGLIPVLASGSRLATLATGAAVCFLLFRRKPVLGAVVAAMLLLAVWGFLATTRQQVVRDSVSFNNALATKGTENSRAELWLSRIKEFESSPLVGIGIGMGTGGGSSQDVDGSLRIEPGSSYLAVLSMTGGLGTIAFISVLALQLFGFAVGQSKPPLEKDILCVVGIFLAVHGVAEGWILSFGGPLCFLFWLWLGNVGDAAVNTVRPLANPRLRQQIKV